MDVHVLVCVHVIEPQAGRAKRLELRAYLHGEVTANPRQEKEPNTGARHIPIEAAVFADQAGHLGSRQDRKAVDEVEVQPYREIWQTARQNDGIVRSRAADHQACGCQNAVSVRFLYGVVDGWVEPEIVCADDQALQLGISRLRRN